MWHEFFPYGFERYLVGGLAIGVGVAVLFVTTGRLGGASTVFSATWSWFSRLPFFQQSDGPDIYRLDPGKPHATKWDRL